MRKLLATIAIATLATIGAAGTVGAGESVCPDLDTGHLDANDQPTFDITAPAGQVIVQVCVKAGSDNQGDGPVFTDFNPGVTETTISHPSGKEISHYSVLFADAPSPNGTTPPNVAPTAEGTAPSDQTTPPGAAPTPQGAAPRAPAPPRPVTAAPSLTG